MLARLAILALGLSLVQAGLKSEWEAYKKAYGKVYSGDENDFRRNIWQKNMVWITTNNIKFYKGEISYQLGESPFTDMTPEEMKKYTGLNMELRKKDMEGQQEEELDFAESLPKEVDWRKEGYVTPVKNQGHCGSCWAFSATGALEGQHFKASGKLVSLSESNLVDCCGSEGCYGCHGCYPDTAMDCIIDHKGIDTEKSYPYKPVDQQCHFNKSNVGATVRSYKHILRGSEYFLQRATAHIGPISVCIDASVLFRHYKSGVLDDNYCERDPNHAVLVVGYGIENGKDYWLVKNSWGEKWGDKGYIKMSRNKRSQCGIADFAMYPVV